MKKLRALVVDDEFAAREMFKRIVDWDSLYYEQPTFATNGAEALSLLGTQDFDIVFTDIMMPIMDGIDFIARARKLKPQQKIVIISCYEKFEYAQAAVRLGVQDYIVKDLMTENEMKALLVPAGLDSGQQRFHTPNEGKLWMYLRTAAKGGDIPDEPFAYKFVSVFLVSPDDYDNMCFEKGDDVVDNRIEAFANSVNCLCYYNNGDGNVYMLFETGETDSIMYFISATYSTAGSIRTKAEEHNIGSITIGVSDPVKSSGELRLACHEAQQALDMRIIEGPHKTLLYNCILPKRNMVDFDRINYLLNRVKKLWISTNPSVIGLIDKLFSIEFSAGFVDMNYYRYINSELWSTIITLAQRNGYLYEQIFSELPCSLDDVNGMETNEMMAQFFKSMIMKFISSASENKQDIISETLRIIEDEYMNNISLSYIAESLHTHKSYLCRLFKEKMGENIAPYIENVRIERAKHLLANTQQKLYEVADNVGFSSSQYFSLVFKKVTGLSPTEYKKKVFDNLSS